MPALCTSCMHSKMQNPVWMCMWAQAGMLLHTFHTCTPTQPLFAWLCAQNTVWCILSLPSVAFGSDPSHKHIELYFLHTNCIYVGTL